MSFYIVPETYTLLQTLRGSYRQAARKIDLHPDFWSWSIVERRAWFVREVMVSHMPQEILPGDLIAGGRFNIQTSLCLDENEQEDFDEALLGKNGARAKMKWFHDHGYGNAGATSGHLIPDHERALKIGWKGIYADLESKYDALGVSDKKGPAGDQLRAMITAATMARDLAVKYKGVCIDRPPIKPTPAGGRSSCKWRKTWNGYPGAGQDFLGSRAGAVAKSYAHHE